MTITRVGHGTVATNSGLNASVTPVIPAHNAGDLLICRDFTSVTLSQSPSSAGFTSRGNSNSGACAIYAKVATGSDTDPTLIMNGNGIIAAWVDAYRSDHGPFPDVTAIDTDDLFTSGGNADVNTPAMTTGANPGALALLMAGKISGPYGASTLTGGVSTMTTHKTEADVSTLTYTGADEIHGGSPHDYAAATAGVNYTGAGTGAGRCVMAIFAEPAAPDFPGFSVNPTVTANSTTGYTVGFTPDASCDAYLGAFPKDATPPTDLADLIANAIGYVSDAVTGADTLTITGLDFPIHDLYVILDNAGGESSPYALVDELKDPPTGFQYVTIDVPWPGDAESILDGASPAAVDGDIIECSLQTSGAYDITMDADGTFSIDSDTDTSAQTFLARFYDVSIADWSDDPAVTIYVNWQVPDVDDLSTVAYPLDEAITPEDLRLQASDPQLSDITVTVSPDTIDALNTGLSVTTSTKSGTPTVAQIRHVTFRFANEAGLYTDSTQTNITGDHPVPSVVGEQEGDAIIAIELAYFEPAVVYASSDTVPAGEVITQDPAGASGAAPFSTVTITVSRGLPSSGGFRTFNDFSFMF